MARLKRSKCHAFLAMGSWWLQLAMMPGVCRPTQTWKGRQAAVIAVEDVLKMVTAAAVAVGTEAGVVVAWAQ